MYNLSSDNHRGIQDWQPKTALQGGPRHCPPGRSLPSGEVDQIAALLLVPDIVPGQYKRYADLQASIQPDG